MTSDPFVWQLIKELTPTEKKLITNYYTGIGELNSATYKLFKFYCKLEEFDDYSERKMAEKLGIKSLSHAKKTISDKIQDVCIASLEKKDQKINLMHQSLKHWALINRFIFSEPSNPNLNTKIIKQALEFLKNLEQDEQQFGLFLRYRIHSALVHGKKAYEHYNDDIFNLTLENLEQLVAINNEVKIILELQITEYLSFTSKKLISYNDYIYLNQLNPLWDTTKMLLLCTLSLPFKELNERLNDTEKYEFILRCFHHIKKCLNNNNNKPNPILIYNGIIVLHRIPVSFISKNLNLIKHYSELINELSQINTGVLDVKKFLLQSYLEFIDMTYQCVSYDFIYKLVTAEELVKDSYNLILLNYIEFFKIGNYNAIKNVVFSTRKMKTDLCLFENLAHLCLQIIVNLKRKNNDYALSIIEQACRFIKKKTVEDAKPIFIIQEFLYLLKSKILQNSSNDKFINFKNQYLALWEAYKEKDSYNNFYFDLFTWIEAEINNCTMMDIYTSKGLFKI